MRRLPFFTTPPRLPLEDAEALRTNPNCVLCKYHETAQNRCVPPAVVRPDASGETLLVLFEAPGSTDDVANQPAMTAGGRYARQVIEMIWPGRVVYTHATACYPGKTRANVSYVEKCRGYVAAVDRDFRPSRILALGATAMRSVIGFGAAPMSIRKSYAHLSDGRMAFFLMNPMHVQRNSFLRVWFEEDVKWSLLATPPRAPWDGYAHVCETVEESLSAIQELRDDIACGARAVSVDVEGFGETGDSDSRALTIALTTQPHMAFVWDEAVIGELAYNRVLAPVLELLGDPEGADWVTPVVGRSVSASTWGRNESGAKAWRACESIECPR